MIVSLLTFSDSSIFESLFKISFWMTRFIGLAPNWGSNPTLAMWSMAFFVVESFMLVFPAFFQLFAVAALLFC
jgi:hypothetical protein